MCGGAVEIVPCSRVGHYFRFTPFAFNGDKVEVELHNNIRTAEVWMDQYKIYYDTLIQREFCDKNRFVESTFYIKNAELNFQTVLNFTS